VKQTLDVVITVTVINTVDLGFVHDIHVVGIGIVDGVKHGTSSAYGYHGCRCEECTAAAVERVKAWRLRHPDRAAKHTRKQNEKAKIARRAAKRLADKYPGEYQKLIDE